MPWAAELLVSVLLRPKHAFEELIFPHATDNYSYSIQRAEQPS
jgi:hypothetical protein